MATGCDWDGLEAIIADVEDALLDVKNAPLPPPSVGWNWFMSDKSFQGIDALGPKPTIPMLDLQPNGPSIVIRQSWRT